MRVDPGSPIHSRFNLGEKRACATLQKKKWSTERLEKETLYVMDESVNYECRED